MKIEMFKMSSERKMYICVLYLTNTPPKDGKLWCIEYNGLFGMANGGIKHSGTLHHFNVRLETFNFLHIFMRTILENECITKLNLT